MELTFEFLSFIQKRFIELCQHCSKNCAAGEERRYVRYGLHFQIPVGELTDYLATSFHLFPENLFVNSCTHCLLIGISSWVNDSYGSYS